MAVTDLARWLEKGDFDRVEKTHAELLGQPPGGASLIEHELAFHEVGGPLLVDMIARGTKTTLTHAHIAALLAQEGTTAMLERIVNAHAKGDLTLPLLACLVSETALRGKDLRGAREAGVLQARLQEAKHPYRALPWTSPPLEAQVKESLKHYSVGGSSMGLPFGPRHGVQMPENTRGLPEKIEPLPLEPLEAAGQIAGEFIESFVYAGRFSSAPDALSRALLVRCRLPILGDARAESVYLEKLSPETVFVLLLLANMGAIPYGRDYHGAECRHRAWRAMGQLAGVPVEELDVARVEAAVRACEWAYFDAASAWFIQEYCDLGIVALRPDRRSLALLAGTATD